MYGYLAVFVAVVVGEFGLKCQYAPHVLRPSPSQVVFTPNRLQSGYG